MWCMGFSLQCRFLTLRHTGFSSYGAQALDCTGSVVAVQVKAPPANTGDAGSIPGLGRSPGGGNGNPLQYSCLENSIDKETWWATVHGVTKELDTTECPHRHTPSEPSWPTLTVGSHRTGSSASKCRLLIKHQEARF